MENSTQPTMKETPSVELEIKTDKKVLCTFYRAKAGCCVPKRKHYKITDMPKELYNEFFQKKV